MKEILNNTTMLYMNNDYFESEEDIIKSIKRNDRGNERFVYENMLGLTTIVYSDSTITPKNEFEMKFWMHYGNKFELLFMVRKNDPLIELVGFAKKFGYKINNI